MPARRLALLAFGVVAVASSSILIRLADAPALPTAFYRNALAALVVVPLAVVRHRDELRRLERRDWGIALLAGSLLAVHFAAWVPSLSYTTVAASTVLVTTQPIWVAVIGGAFLGEHVSRRGVLGIACSLTGAVLISGGDFGGSGRAALGDGLAIAGAVAAAGYYVAGRDLRQRVSLLTYVGVVYATCAVGLGLAMLVSRTPFTGFAPKTWAYFALIALAPQVIGHTMLNYLLAEMEAGVVVMAITGEPVIASIVAIPLFDEIPSATAVLGAALILGGIAATVTAQARRPQPAPVQ